MNLPGVPRGDRIAVRDRSAQVRPADRFPSGAVVVARWAVNSSQGGRSGRHAVIRALWCSPNTRADRNVKADKSSGKRILEGVNISSTPDQAQPNPSAISEDWRGVDIAQIRRQIQMTPAERLRHMTQCLDQVWRIQRAAHRGR